jgi:SAM-dependent methyltransferase
MTGGDPIRSAVADYYTAKVREHGPTARGVDWNGEESQELRFAQLLRVADGLERPFSLLDYGCGYGALADWLERRGIAVDYRGFDLSDDMVRHARVRRPHAAVTTREDELEPADVAVASGIFNVRLDVDDARWADYVEGVIRTLDRLGTRGIAFNMLTSWSDPPFMRDDLFYGDPCAYFSLCKRELSRHVALLHDYGLYEFTIIVRKDDGA